MLVLAGCFLVIGIVLLYPRAALACTTIVVGVSASATGRVLVGHNEDDPGRAVVRHGFVPAQRHVPGTKTAAEDYAARPEQPSETGRFFWTEVRQERGASSADCFVNQWGVVLVSNSCAFSRKDDEPDLTAGGLGWGLRRALAEGARTAREGAEMAARLLDQWGYRLPGRSYTLADAREAWIVQVAMGKTYAAVRLGDDEVAVIPNHFTLRAGDLRRPHLLSPDALARAKARGWCPDSVTEMDFDFAQAFQDPDSANCDGNTYRHRHGLVAFTGRLLSPDEPLPFAVKPLWSVTPESLRAVLRDHYTGTADDLSIDFAGSSPHYTPRRRICTGGTVESWVALPHETAELTELQISRGRPCSCPYQTFDLLGGLPHQLDPLSDPVSALESHCAADSSQLDDGLAWHKLFEAQTLIDLRYSQLHEPLERWVASRQAALDESTRGARDERAGLVADGRVAEAEARSTARAQRDADETERELDELLKSFAPTELTFSAPEVAKADPNETLTVTFDWPTTPDEPSFRLGQSGAAPMTWASPLSGSLNEAGQSRWTMAFRVREATESALPCKAGFWLAGRDTGGQPVVAFGRLTVRAPRDREKFSGHCSL